MLGKWAGVVAGSGSGSGSEHAAVEGSGTESWELQELQERGRIQTPVRPGWTNDSVRDQHTRTDKQNANIEKT